MESSKRISSMKNIAMKITGIKDQSRPVSNFHSRLEQPNHPASITFKKFHFTPVHRARPSKFSTHENVSPDFNIQPQKNRVERGGHEGALKQPATRTPLLKPSRLPENITFRIGPPRSSSFNPSCLAKQQSSSAGSRSRNKWVLRHKSLKSWIRDLEKKKRVEDERVKW